MKKLITLASLIVMMVACQPTSLYKIADFNEIILPEAGYLDAELNGSFVSGDVTFYSQWVPEFGGYSDGGIYPSNLNDKVTPGFLNQYSAMPTTSGNFAVVHYSEYNAGLGNNYAYFTLPSETTVNGIDVAISTYAYWAIKVGDDGIGAARAFTDGDWHKVIFTGFDINGNKLGEVEHYLADFRDGKSYISTSWETVSLTSLGDKVYKIEISIDGTDKAEWGINTPTYCCIDNIEYKF